MSNRKIGTWIYSNSGGDVVEQKMIAKLKERGIDTITDLNLKTAFSDNNKIICNGINMEELDAFFSYNAGQQTQYQMYLYEILNTKIPIFNNYTAFALTEDKFKTNKRLRDCGVDTTDFFLCNKEDMNMLDDVLAKWGKIVYKPVDGWGGVGMILIEDQKTLNIVKPLIAKSDTKFFYVEKFVNYDGTDFRIDIVNGEYISCYGRRAKSGDWRTNVAVGGSVFLREPNDDVVLLALNATKATGLEIAGVDLIYDIQHQKHIVLEVNGIPAFATPSQEAMGLDFNDKKIDKLVDLLDNATKK